MSTSANLERVQQMYAAFGRGDIPSILDALATDATWHVQGPARVPMFGLRRGRREIAEFFQSLVENAAIEQFEPREFVAQGERVVVLGYERGRAKSTGQSFEGEWAHIFMFRQGQVISFREYCDSGAIADAFDTQRGSPLAA